MNDNKECTLLSMINSLPDGVAWLIRSDEEQGFLANVMSSEFSISRGQYGINSHAYASNPIQALENAYNGYKILLN